MSTPITCPNCHTSFNIDDVLTADIEKNIREQYETQNRQLVETMQGKEQELLRKELDFEEKRKRQNELFQQQLQKQTAELRVSLEAEMRKKAEEESHAKMELLQRQLEEQRQKTKTLQEKELEVLTLNRQLADQKEQERFNLEKQKLELETELKAKLSEQLHREADEKHSFELKKLRQQLDQQAKLIDEQKRKMEQGSMEQQGEIQENLVKERLIALFPFDDIADVKKGSRGGDIVQTIRNSSGKVCGQIVYESKNTKGWNNDWIDKLQDDVREQKADLGVLISQTLPKHIRHIGKEKSIWVCGFSEFEGVAAMLREGLISVYESKQSEENKGDKMVMLYEYLNGNEFRQKWEAILNGFRNMKRSIDKQRDFYIKTLAEQDQIANSILLNANTFLGDIKGIAGSSMDEIKLLE